MEAQTTTVTHSFFDTFKVKIQDLLAQFKFSWKTITELAVGFGAGFLLGFLVKRYARQVIVLLVLFSVVLIGLEYFNFISIDWTAIKNFIGLPTQTLESIAQEYFTWAKEHILTVVTGLIGFLIGYKVG
jgi:uncharacterized membrane protein (Fun14 family)